VGCDWGMELVLQLGRIFLKLGLNFLASSFVLCFVHVGFVFKVSCILVIFFKKTKIVNLIA